jgi:hypothetical protein
MGIIDGEEEMVVDEEDEETSRPSLYGKTDRREKKSEKSVLRNSRKSQGGVSGSDQSIVKSNQNMTLFQHRKVYQKRWSDDTIFLGKTGTNRTFEEKIELMKKVWEVYQYMREEGLTFEAAKIYLGSQEVEVLEEADILTRGNLLRFLTALLPDERKYPFERPIKTNVPKYHGLPNALAIKLFSIEKKFSLR